MILPNKHQVLYPSIFSLSFQNLLLWYLLFPDDRTWCWKVWGNMVRLMGFLPMRPFWIIYCGFYIISLLIKAVANYSTGMSLGEIIWWTSSWGGGEMWYVFVQGYTILKQCLLLWFSHKHKFEFPKTGSFCSGHMYVKMLSEMNIHFPPSTFIILYSTLADKVSKLAHLSWVSATGN